MFLIPVANIVLLVTLNGAIPLLSSNSTSNVISNSSLELPPLTWPPNDGYCRKSAACVSHNSTCFGVPLPYSEISTEVVVQLFQNPNLRSFKNLEQELKKWESLRRVPKCWQTLQPFLCALFMPKCEQDTVYLLSQERCRYTMSTCRILKEPPFLHTFPAINCDAVEFFPPTCKNDVKDLRSNLSGECIAPLIATDNSESYYDVVNGCGVQCEDPLITRDEHEQIHKMIAWGATVSFFCNLFTVVSFLIEWRSGNKYPAVIIFYINVCFLLSNVGWLAQFFLKAREDIVCKKDLTLRRSEPSAEENLSCVVVFVVIYYFLMAACVWFVIFTYAWHLSCRGLGKIQERIDKKGAYFHLVAWSLPVVLTITVMASRQIDGNSIAGICFVRSSYWGARVGFLLVPIAVTMVIGGYYLGRGLPFLFSIKRDSQQILSEKASAKISEMIVRIGLFSFFCFIFVVVTFICHIYEFVHEEEWQKSFRNYVFCLILSSKSDPRDCQMESRPSVAMIQLHLLIKFAAGVVMSSWAWISSTADTWKRFFNRKIFKKEIEESIVLKKHKIIAQAFAKRKELTNAGKLDLCIRNSHTDPVGLKFELNSTASHLSSNWIAAIPKLVDRRGALVEPLTESNSSKRRNSYDSESYTYSVRRVSVESRRHSLDSQISLQISEVTATHKTKNPRPSHRSGRSRGKRRRKDFSRTRKHSQNATTRRGSSTSQESQIDIKILTALAFNNSNILPNLLKRRPGNAGLESNEKKFQLPNIDVSDDEHSHGANIMGFSDDEASNASEELCPPGEGFQALDQGETDSDHNQKLSLYQNYSDDDETTEIEKIERILRREKAFTAKESYRNKLKIEDLEYERKSFEHDRKYKFRSDYYSNKHIRHSRSRDVGRQKKIWDDSRGSPQRGSRHYAKASKVDERSSRKSKSSYKTDKRRKSSVSDGEEGLPMIKKAESGDIVEALLPLETLLPKTKMSGTEDIKLTDSESEYDENSQLMQSVGVQIRADSRRSKGSVTVDVGTQISTQEMATQTDPHDYNNPDSVQSTSSQGTQMTPPLHIRLIDKALRKSERELALGDKNYSYSSLTGVVLTHENVVAGVCAVLLQLGEHRPTSSDCMMSFLPLAHMLERCCEHGLFISGGCVGCYSGDIKRLSEDMKALKPTVMPAVPRLLKRIYDKVVSQVSGSFIKRTLCNMALGAKESELKRGIIRNNSLWDKLIFRKVQESLGERLRWMPVHIRSPVSCCCVKSVDVPLKWSRSDQIRSINETSNKPERR